MATGSRIRWPRSSWGFGRDRAFPPWWKYGLLLPYRTLASRAWLPGARERRQLAGDVYPYWHVIDTALIAFGSTRNAILPDSDFTGLALMASATQLPPSFRAQWFQVISSQRGYRMNRVGVDFPNMFGSGARPFFLRRPYNFPNRRSVLNLAANRTAGIANTVQMVWYGVRRYGSGEN